MINFFKKNFLPILLIFIAIFSHWEWFNPKSITTYSDWSYIPTSTLNDLPSIYGAWINVKLGEPNIQLYFNAFRLPWYLLSLFGIDFSTSSKVNIFMPVALLGFISPFLLGKDLIKNNFIAFVGSVFYGSTIYFLTVQTIHLTIAFLYAIAPLIFLFFKKSLESNKISNWIAFAVIFSIGIYYEVRIMYIISIILILYLILFYSRDLKRHLFNFSVSGFLIILLNGFWLLPTIFATENVQTIADRSLFGSYLSNIGYSFNVFNWAWTGLAPNIAFKPQPIPVYLWIFPMIIFSFLVLIKKIHYKESLFFLLITLLGILLSKQEGEPFISLYSFLYANFPGFSIFRESSKFNTLTAFGFLGIMNYGLISLKNKKHGKKMLFFFSSLILLFSFWNLKPFVTKEIGTLLTSRSIPHDYIKTNEFLNNENKFYRTLSLPVSSRWLQYSSLHPKIGMIDLINSDKAPWSAFVDERYVTNSSFLNLPQKMIGVLKSSNGNNLLDSSSIKYVIIPIKDVQNEDDFFTPFVADPSWYKKQLDRVEYLKKSPMSTDQLAIYENFDYRDRIYATMQQEKLSGKLPIVLRGVNYDLKNSAEYQVRLSKISDPIFLYFNDNFNPNWKIRVGKFEWYHSVTKSNYFLNDQYHFKSPWGYNGFIIDPGKICEDYNCEKENGNYNLELTIYYFPQAYYYLGAVITLGAFSLVLIFFMCKKVYGKNI